MPQHQAHVIELGEDDLDRPAQDLRMLSGSIISRIMAYGGVTHITGINGFMRLTARVNIMWQIKWLLGAMDGRANEGPASLNGCIPWFKNWGGLTWAVRTLPAWNYTSEWPDIDECGLGYIEKIYALGCWECTQTIVRNAIKSSRHVLVNPFEDGLDGGVSAAVSEGSSSGRREAGRNKELELRYEGWYYYSELLRYIGNDTFRQWASACNACQENIWRLEYG